MLFFTLWVKNSVLTNFKLKMKILKVDVLSENDSFRDSVEETINIISISLTVLSINLTKNGLYENFH